MTGPALVFVADGAPIVTVGAVVSTSTPAVEGGVKVCGASLLAESLMVPPFRFIGDVAAIPSVSVSPAWTVYRNTSALVPLPET